jgi:Helix-destabilising protein
MKLTVKSTNVQERKIHSTKQQKDYVFREQEAVVELGEERRLIVLSLEDGQQAYPVGQYEVLDGSFEVDRNRNLALKRRLALKPLTVAAAPGAARQVG